MHDVWTQNMHDTAIPHSITVLIQTRKTFMISINKQSCPRFVFKPVQPCSFLARFTRRIPDKTKITADDQIIIFSDCLFQLRIQQRLYISFTLKAPASSTALASRISCLAVSSVFPCTLNPPKALTDCGVSPICPITGMDASTIALI